MPIALSICESSIVDSGRRNLSLCLADICEFKCLIPDFLKVTLPVPVILNLFLADLLVFCLGIEENLIIEACLISIKKILGLDSIEDGIIDENTYIHNRL